MGDEALDTSTGVEESEELAREALEPVATFMTGQILSAGVRLGIFEVLADDGRPASAVADELDLHPGYAYRLLRALASLGFLNEEAEQKFSLSPKGKLCQDDHPRSIRDGIRT